MVRERRRSSVEREMRQSFPSGDLPTSVMEEKVHVDGGPAPLPAQRNHSLLKELAVALGIFCCYFYFGIYQEKMSVPPPPPVVPPTGMVCVQNEEQVWGGGRDVYLHPVPCLRPVRSQRPLRHDRFRHHEPHRPNVHAHGKLQ